MLRWRSQALLALAGLLFAASIAGAAAQRAYAAQRPSFVLFGDSITEFGYNGPSGWVTQLGGLYSRKADVLNRGLSGYNSRWGLLALPGTLADLQRVQLVVIWFGANDAVTPSGKDGRLSVPLAEYQANIAAMVQVAKDAGVPHILVLTPPPVDEAEHAKQAKLSTSDRTNAALQKYADAAKAAAASKGVPVVDIFGLFSSQPADKRRGLFYDGVHPGAEGNNLIFAAVRDALGQNDAFKALRPYDMPHHLPPFDMVDAKQPQGTFKELENKKLVRKP